MYQGRRGSTFWDFPAAIEELATYRPSIKHQHLSHFHFFSVQLKIERRTCINPVNCASFLNSMTPQNQLPRHRFNAIASNQETPLSFLPSSAAAVTLFSVSMISFNFHPERTGIAALIIAFFKARFKNVRLTPQAG